jgi:microcystin-dependent protein
MAQPYVGEIRMFAGNFAPAGWLFCEGQLVQIAENETLFQLIGTTYGGDGQVTFAMPDLRGRLPIHQGSGFTLSQTGGVKQVTLTTNQLPVHTHPVMATSDLATSTGPAGAYLGTANTSLKFYSSASPTVGMAPNLVGNTGGSQPHDNFQPYLCVDFIISLFGIFPSPN